MKSSNTLRSFYSVLAGLFAWGTVFPETLPAAEIPSDSFWSAPAPAPAKPATVPAKEAPRPKTEATILSSDPRMDALEKRLSELSASLEQMGKTWASSSAGWTMGYKDNGGGFFWESPDKAFVMKLLGYGQINHQWTDARGAALRAGSTKPVANDFYIRRARLDFSATVYKNTELFMELESGVPTSATSQSDFALVEAKITQKVADAFQVRVGKFLAPLSNENSMRSSRALDTIERYTAVNTLVGAPAIEAQMGTLVFGDWAKKRYAYAVGVFNGNNKTADNYRDNNSQKEIVTHFTWKPLAAKPYSLSGMAFGFGTDLDRGLTQTLSLKTLGGTTLSSVGVTGDRWGLSTDVYFPITPWLEVRGESLLARFNDSRTKLYGGFGQVLFHFWKNAKGAEFSPLVRVESAVISENNAPSLSRLNTLTLGWNLFLNKNVVWRVNYLPSHFRSQGSSASITANGGHYDEVLNQIQVKF